ncbi:hypothetical protein AAFF_G00291770 [Aldrovandia affinis]|uniref:Zinc finger homeobox protein 4 n=1 Tax=Aldrovandia affinis TaxID=143900 RepID=A0AAD7WRM7_9TELE|nr:hypothetical protein AAFF_G00291770 [Aldrovandia affinis]
MLESPHEPDRNSKGTAKTTTNDHEQIEKDVRGHKKTKTELGINTLPKDSPETVAIGKRSLVPENENDTAPKRPQSAEETANNEQNNQCSYCSYNTTDPNRMAMHVLSQHSLRSTLCCPLCDDILSSKIHLQLHLTHLHSVAADCVEKLLADVSETDVQMPQNMVLPETVKDRLLHRMDTTTVTQNESGKPQGASSSALKRKAQNKGLEGLQNVLEVKPPKGPSDTPSWKRSCEDQKNLAWPWKDQSGLQKQQQHLVSDRHGYKHRSDYCGLEAEELQAHSQHRAITVCALCLRGFHTVLALKKHLESVHPELSEADVQCLCRTPPVIGDFYPESEDRAFELKQHKDLDKERKESPTRSDSGSPLAEMSTEPKRTGPLRKGPNFFVEKFLDPSRPYKCTVCKESFTQKNILLVHYNSVSHLHKLNKVLHETSSPGLQESGNSFDNKPHKCNICNVAYNQSSTLEIHMRSVLHQTKARTAKVETGSSISNGNYGTALAQSPATVIRETMDSASLPVTAHIDNHTKAKETNRKQTAENISTLLSQQQALSPAQLQLQLQHDLTQQAAFFQPQFLNPAFWPPLSMSPNVLLQFQQPQFLFPFYLPGAEVKLSPELAQSAFFGLPGMTGSLLEDLTLQQSQFQQLQQQAAINLACDSEVQMQKEQEQTNKPEVEQNDTAISDIQMSKDVADQSEKPESKAQQEKLNDFSGTTDNGDVKKHTFSEPPFLPPRVILGARGNAARALLENFGFELVIQYIENRQRNQRKNECAEVAIANKLECGTCGKLFSNILILKNHQEHGELDPDSLQQLESKRPRTRITNEQLKILRSHFNINSSPDEEKVQEMAEKSGLRQKVIKHWFRNTLFKERQRSKDSPYNFNIPPITTSKDLTLEAENPLETGRLSIDRPGHRRSRTQMSNQQVMVLKACFSDCRTPTMHECESLGDKIGLAKRVVQVWFQNARAKEKKFKINVGKPFVVSQSSPDGPLPECILCGTRFTTTFPIREHVFSKLHVDKLQETLRNQVDREKDHLTPTTVRQLMAQQEFERFKKRAMDSLGTTAQQQTVTDGNALLSLSWPTGYSGITGLPSGINGPYKLPSFPSNTPGSPGDGFPSPVTPSTAVSLSCTPTKTLLQTTPPPVPSTPLASHQIEQQNLDKPKKSEQPKRQRKDREANSPHFDLKKREEGVGGNRTVRKKAPSRLLSTVAGDPGTFLAGQFLPYFVPGLVPCLPPQLPGFAQGGSFPPLCGMENLFPYGPGLPQAIAGLSSAALMQQCQQYQLSLPETLQQQKPLEGQRQKPAPAKPSKIQSDRLQPKEEDVGYSAESTDQEPQTGAGSTDSPEALITSSVRGEFACEKCRAVFPDKESAVRHQETSCCFGQSFSALQEAELHKVTSSKYNCSALNLAISKNKALSQHGQSSQQKDKAGTSESQLSLPADICSDKLGGELSHKLDNIENSMDIKTKATSGLGANFRSIRMDMFTV